MAGSVKAPKHVPLESGFPAMIQRQDKFISVDFRMLFSSYLEAMSAPLILKLVVIHFEWVQSCILSYVLFFYGIKSFNIFVSCCLIIVILLITWLASHG